MQNICAKRIEVLSQSQHHDNEASADDREGSEHSVMDSTQTIPKSKSLDDVRWFHKGMGRNAAEAILLTNACEGTYLLRDSVGNPGHYTLSVRYSDSVKHFSIRWVNGIYQFGVGEFESLQELLEHFECLPVLGTDTGGTVTLSYPYYNNISEPNIYEEIVRHAEGSRVMSRSAASQLSPDLHIASKEGYLVKRGAIHKNWKKRWFTLQKNELKYFRIKGASKPIRTLNLENALDIREDDTMDKLNCFALVFPWRTFYFYAGSSREAGEWIRILKWKLDYYYNRKHSKVTADPLGLCFLMASLCYLNPVAKRKQLILIPTYVFVSSENSNPTSPQIQNSPDKKGSEEDTTVNISKSSELAEKEEEPSCSEEMLNNSPSSRPRFSHHSLSFSAGSSLADLISKARSEFSLSLKEDMKRFNSAPRLSKSRKLPDLNDNILPADTTMEADESSARTDKANLKLNLDKTASFPDASSMSSFEHSPRISSPLQQPDTLIADSLTFATSPRLREDGNMRSLSPRLNGPISANALNSPYNNVIHSSPSSSEYKKYQSTFEFISKGEEAIATDGSEATRKEHHNLEERIKNQNDEILILKTALANVVRRLETLESEKKQKGNGHNASWGSMKNVIPAAAILPSQPKSPMKHQRDSIDEESPRSPEKEKVVTSRKPLARKSSDASRKSSFSSSQSISISEKRRGSVTRKSSSDLRRSGSLGNLSTGEKDENQPVKFYIRGRAINTYPPSGFIETRKTGSAPDKQLKLEWVYGYRGKDSRNNLLTLATGEIVYHIAAVVIIYDRYTGEQRHYVGHNDDVKCIALHPDKVIVASGQVAGHDKDEGKPHVRVWDSETLETRHVIGLGYFERALCCLAFSIKDGGRLLVAIDEANEHVISIWDWEKKLRYSENKSSNDAVLGVIFHPENNNIMVSHGRSHIAFWTINEEMKITKKMGVFERHGKPKFVLCATFTENGDLLSGDSNGNILLWGQGSNRVTKALKDAHDGAIFSICCMSDGKILSGGGKDRKVIEWNQYLQKTGHDAELPEYSGQVRTIVEGQMQDDDTIDIIVGTTKNCILDGSLSNGLGVIVQGHVDELWGLATHSTKDMFVTCSTDEKVILWDAENHDVIWVKQLKESAQSAAFHPDANIIAIGTKSGRWLVLDSETSDEIASFQDGPEQHDAIKYSKDGKYIAVGSHDNFIYLYTVSEDGRTYKKAGKLSGHSSFITHLDWSKDSQYIQSNSGDYEILFWNALSSRQIVNACSMKDVEWDSWTCVLGFPVIGIWPEGADGTDINACCRSNNSEYLVTGDDFGQVNFFTFPSPKPKSDCQHCIGHSSHVTCVRFMHDDTRVISVGGKDCSVMQWRISSE
eukprot:gene17440-19184_t